MYSSLLVSGLQVGHAVYRTVVILVSAWPWLEKGFAPALHQT